jgi:hypothetical protein
MSFDSDVFISYAHIDNQPLPGGQDGWVTVFHEALEQFLSRFKGSNARVWRDKKLRGNDVFSNEIMDQFPKTAALISVLTPRYLSSEWCTKEINGFCGVAQQTGGLVVENKTRVFKVIKTPFDQEEALPPVVDKVLGYDFYELDEDSTPRELDPQFGDKVRQEFLRKVNKLAWDSKRLLDQLGSGVHDAAPANGAAKPIVYLAECSRDRREAREILEGELKRHGYAVLPDQQLPTDEAAVVAEVQGLLAKCTLSVHLVGTGYGIVPDGSGQKSVGILQNELAATRAKSGALRRVIWLPEGIRSEHAAQQGFIDALHNDAEAQVGADLITGDLEAVKGAIHAALKKLERPAPESAPTAELTGDSRRLVYIVCDERDRKETVPLLKLLKGRGLDVKLPIFTGDAAEVREANQELLMRADAVVIFYGAGDEAWKYYKQNELKKIGGLRRERPILAEYTYLAGPTTDDKELLVSLEEPNVIDGRNGFAEATMEGLLRALSPGKVTRARPPAPRE